MMQEVSFQKVLVACTIWSAVLIALPVQCVRQGTAKCLDIPIPECALFFNGVHGRKEVAGLPSSLPPWYSTFPSKRGLFLPEALTQFGNFEALLSLNNYCSYILHIFLCLHYFPPCDPTRPPDSEELPTVLPCRAICEEAWSECLNFVYHHHNIPRPEHLNCSNFPVASEPSDFLACPNLAVHLDFCLPFGVKEYNVSESAEYLEVCIKVASTGSYEALTSPIQVYISYEDISATGGEDYKGGLIESENLNQILSFPTGSVKGSRRCFNITITNDLLVEEQEMFSVNVRVDDAEAAQFGGALNSSTGSVAVNIIDNDECFLPRRYCKKDECKQRPKASGDTFMKNNYTFAAHIELLGVEHYDRCTAVNARIIRCWEIRRNTCPPVNTLLTIPTCKVCPTLPVANGGHYLVAGIHHKIKMKRRILLPSRRRAGLFAPWDDEHYADINEWIRRARAGK